MNELALRALLSYIEMQPGMETRAKKDNRKTEGEIIFIVKSLEKWNSFITRQKL